MWKKYLGVCGYLALQPKILSVPHIIVNVQFAGVIVKSDKLKMYFILLASETFILWSAKESMRRHVFEKGVFYYHDNVIQVKVSSPYILIIPQQCHLSLSYLTPI